MKEQKAAASSVFLLDLLRSSPLSSDLLLYLLDRPFCFQLWKPRRLIIFWLMHFSSDFTKSRHFFLCNEELQVQAWRFKKWERVHGVLRSHGRVAGRAEQVMQFSWTRHGRAHFSLTGADHMPVLATTRRTSWRDKVLKRMIFKHNRLQRLHLSQFQHILELIITNVGHGCHSSSPHLFASALQGSVQPELVVALTGCSPAAMHQLFAQRCSIGKLLGVGAE